MTGMVVIGSGPAGVACASGLLARGLPVTMLDAGVTLPEDKADIIHRLRVKWDESLAGQCRQELNFSDPVKLSYASDYPYAEVSEHMAFRMDAHTQCTSSFAQGGLTNVWGACIADYQTEDMLDWPVNRAQLDPYYRIVFPMLYSAVSSEASDAATAAHVYHASAQAKLLAARWKKHQESLHMRGIGFASSMLAVKFGRPDATQCIYCGHCQHGCVFDLIYSARHTLGILLKNPLFRYVQHAVVTSVGETAEGVTVHAHHRITGEKQSFEGARVFSACGPAISTKLFLEAAGINAKVAFKDSSHFILPCLMYRRTHHVETERLHTLAQLCLKIRMGESDVHPVNLQLYTYQDHYTERVKDILGKAYPLLRGSLHPLVDRLIAIQGHLHSTDSHAFTMHLDASKTAHLETVWNPRTAMIINKTIRHLYKNAGSLGFVPIPGAKIISKVGKSFHYGCSIPMRRVPGQNESDLFGRPFGFTRWHIVDASIFPSIPAGSIVPSLMANAYRIATECPL